MFDDQCSQAIECSLTQPRAERNPFPLRLSLQAQLLFRLKQDLNSFRCCHTSPRYVYVLEVRIPNKPSRSRSLQAWPQVAVIIDEVVGALS